MTPFYALSAKSACVEDSSMFDGSLCRYIAEGSQVDLEVSSCWKQQMHDAKLWRRYLEGWRNCHNLGLEDMCCFVMSLDQHTPSLPWITCVWNSWAVLDAIIPNLAMFLLFIVITVFGKWEGVHFMENLTQIWERVCLVHTLHLPTLVGAYIS